MVLDLPLPEGGRWDTVIFNNTLHAYLEAAVVFLGLLLAFYLVQWLLLKRLSYLASRTTTDVDDTALKIVENIKPPVYTVVALYAAVRTLELGELAVNILNGILIAILVYQVIASLQILFDFIITKRVARSEDPGDRRTEEAALDILHQIASIVLWAIGVLFILSNFGVNVTSLIAGLGIGGLAFALAAQNILTDLFASLSIYLDKPFRLGDTIKIRDDVGTVKKIGIKTTRLKSIDGEEIIYTNKELTSAKVENFQGMKKRRVLVELGVTYETPGEKLETLPAVIEQNVTGLDQVEFGRAHFKAFGDSALIFELVYHVTDGSYETYMNVQQTVNYRLKKAFDELGVEFAYPTQTILVNQT